MIYAAICIGLLLFGLWLSWFVGRMQDQIDRRYINEDES